MSLPPRTPGGADLNTALILVQQLDAALRQDDRARLMDLVRQLTDMRAPLGQQWHPIAQLALDKGEHRLARAAIDLFVENAGNIPAAHYQKAALLAQSHAWGEAFEVLDCLPQDVPSPAANAYSRGVALLNLDRAEEGRACLERVAGMHPQSGTAWLMLASSGHMGEHPNLAERIVGAERALAAAPVTERAAYYYALGKVHADRGAPASALAAFARGAGEMKAARPYSREQDRAFAAEATRGYDAAAIASVARRQTAPTGRTIFVGGLPRSGTTLLEQILVSHSTVRDGGEIDLLRLLAAEAGGTSWPALEGYVERSGTAAAAQLWDHWLDERFGAGGRVVDKTTTTGRYLGLVAALLPEAPLIWITRDPLDRAWSCFRTLFAGDMAWSYDLRDIAWHFRLEDQLLASWRDLLGDRLLVVPYEGLVDDPPAWTRRILGHCGLAEEPQVFAPHENRRPVTTASLMQVRRPINREGMGAADAYREFLAPFTEAYFA